VVWTGLIWLRIGTSGPVGSCEHGNEPLSSIKCWEVLGLAAQLAASQGGLSSMKFRFFSFSLIYTTVLICYDYWFILTFHQFST
jgi:hypothetical protein